MASIASVQPMEEVAAGVLSLVCIGYNNTFNIWPRFQGALYVPLNLAFAAMTVVAGLALLDLSADEMGLRGDLGDLWLGALIAVTITAPAFALALSRHAARIADRRVAGLRGPQLAYQVLARVPLGTALTEEVVFRGVLYAAWREAGWSTVAATLATAAAFGLWHITPTINLVKANSPAASRRARLLSVLGAVTFSAAASVAFTWLRLETEGLVAPIIVHAGTNSLATVAAVVAARRSRRAKMAPWRR